MRGRWPVAAAAAILLAACACSPQCAATGRAPATPLAATSTAPSPSPTPTAPLRIAAAAFHAGEVGAGYVAVPLAASGGVEPYVWSVGTGSLPDGLTLGSEGSVSGTPTSAGQFSFSIQVADARGGTAALPGSITVAAALSAGLIPSCARACQVETGCVDVCGSFGSVSGGTPPFTYAVNGYVPPATHLNGLSYVGTFTRPISYWQSTVTVTDSFGETASVSPIFNVFAHVALASGSCSGNYLTGCKAMLAISGGGGSFSVKLTGVAPNPTQGCWSPTATAPPAGYALTVTGGSVAVSIPKGLINGYGAVWTLVVTDQSLCAANTYCSTAPATVKIGVQCG